MNWLSILGILGGVAGTLGGVVAWFKLGPERRKLTSDTSVNTSTIYSKLLQDFDVRYQRLCEELDEKTMALVSAEQQLETCHQTCHFLQGERDESILARSRSHIALNTMVSYELHIELLLDELRKCGIAITPEMRPQHIRTAFQAEMKKLETLESGVVENLLTRDANVVPSADGGARADQVTPDALPEPRSGEGDRGGH